MTTHSTINLTTFRGLFPELSINSDMQVNAVFSVAENYISADDVWNGFNGAALDYALQLMTAHLLKVGNAASSGNTQGVVVSSSVADVSVSLMPPPVKSGWQFWLSSTSYGLQLWALLSVRAAGGWTVGGSPESAAFRKAGGFFG